VGRAIAEGLADEGVHVCAVARGSDDLASLADYQARGTIVPVAADLLSGPDIDSAVAAAQTKIGPIDLVVNNVGATAIGALDDVSASDWHAGWNLKVVAAMRICQLLMPEMRSRRSGAIVTIAGLAGTRPFPMYVVGSAVNAAVINMTRALALSGARYNIRANVVSPGPVRTKRLLTSVREIASLSGHDIETVERNQMKMIPLRRAAAPAEIANVVIFLLSDRASYMTGAQVPVDGGASV
jgi:NAD(P)-dependent dehydrogenase (short-subunit alcohol dehydrogenase family)